MQLCLTSHSSRSRVASRLDRPAIAAYARFVHDGARLPSVWTQLHGQIYLGSEAFIKEMQAQIEKRPALDEIPRAQRRALTQPLDGFAQLYPRNEAMARAYLSGQHTLAEIARKTRPRRGL